MNGSTMITGRHPIFPNIVRQIVAGVLLTGVVAMRSTAVTIAEAPISTAPDIPEGMNPCGKLTRMGDKTFIYNNSEFPWSVTFTTHVSYSGFGISTNAGAVKYLDKGMWKDVGLGDYRYSKSYKIPVPAGETVAIAYCTAGPLLVGKVQIDPADPTYRGGRPDNAMHFYANVRPYTYFQVRTVTAFVDYNRDDNKNPQWGSLTICPNDRLCRVP